MAAKIYVFCEKLPWTNEDVGCYALAEDGPCLGQHICSTEHWATTDLGVDGTRPDRHKAYAAYYPDGYTMEFVPMAEVENHAGVQEAIRRNRSMGDNADDTG